ncbi:MAG: hypothetical protein RLZZ387_1659 [Chloroflexota bacterium]|jgi:hypothetical protein
MTQQQGLFTVQTWLTLTPDLRTRLEWLVRQEGGDLAETLTRIVAARRLASLDVTSEPVPGDRLPVRVYLTAEQRADLEGLVAEHKVPLPDILTQVVAARLAGLPEPPAPEEPASPTAGGLRARRAELRRLRARRDAAGATAPAWLHAYIAELEAELGG